MMALPLAGTTTLCLHFKSKPASVSCAFVGIKAPSSSITFIVLTSLYLLKNTLNKLKFQYVGFSERFFDITSTKLIATHIKKSTLIIVTMKEIQLPILLTFFIVLPFIIKYLLSNLYLYYKLSY
jgi:hypothetical protein